MNRTRLWTAALLTTLAGTSHAALVNGGFEQLLVAMPAANYIVTNQSNVPGWRTTATDGNIEVWQAPGPDPTATPAFAGSRFAEVNANQVSSLFQVVSGIAAGSTLDWTLAHRGRFGNDTLRMTLTDLGTDNVFATGDDTVLFTRTFTDGNTAWGSYSGTGITALGNSVRLGFTAVSSVGPDATYGNFIDNVSLTATPGTPVPEPAAGALAGAALLAAAAASRRRRA